MTWLEAIGYLASALIVASLAMSSVVRLRLVNLVGCLVFVGYGIAIGAWPVVVSNAVIAALDVYYLLKERRRSHVAMVPLPVTSPWLEDFLTFHRDDIRKFQPGFEGVDDHSLVWLVTKQTVPAGVLVGQPDGTTLRVTLDHVTPAFRDSGIGAWLYHGGGVRVLREAGFDRVGSDGLSPRHRQYLTSLGFRADGSDLVKDL